jgi:hypothetical protein
MTISVCAQIFIFQDTSQKPSSLPSPLFGGCSSTCNKHIDMLGSNFPDLSPESLYYYFSLGFTLQKRGCLLIFFCSNSKRDNLV